MELLRGGSGGQQDGGLPVWVLPACLLISALACVLLLRFTIGVMSEKPATTTPVTARPAP